MKRFFQPIAKDGSSKKLALSTSTDTPLCPASDGGGDKKEEKRGATPPLKFLTWNANSLLLRAKNNWPEFSRLVQSLDPDVICFQVLRPPGSRQLPATSSYSLLGPVSGLTISSVGSTFLLEILSWRAFGPSRFLIVVAYFAIEVRMPAAGSKGAPKIPSEIKDDTSSSRGEKQVLMRALSNPPFREYHVWWSLSDSKYGGTALLCKKELEPKKVYFSLDRLGTKHEPDGRVILLEFDSCFLLNTYSPNNGWKEEENSFIRRRKWDKRILEFVLQIEKPLIWCGDLNVSHQEIDVSHPEFFSNAKLNGYIPPHKEDCGQPGFTLAERHRFDNILTQGKLIDAYRFLHKDKDMEGGFSWSGNPVGKYRGKRMRIDYFIVSEKLKDKIVTCEMHGHGIELEGFCGSDHCPVSFVLSDETWRP